MYGYGYSYPNNTQGSGLMGNYEAGVISDGGFFAFPIDTGLASRLESLGLLNASSLVNSCNAGKADVLYNLIPTPVQTLDRFSVVRSTVKRVQNSSGVLESVAINTPAFQFNANGSYRGLLVEPAATNLALQSRDLTQAAWSATNVTTSRTATGADGTANTGTILTATAGNGTVLQAITSASSARIFSARVRRRTGTGTVQITQDNGSTYTTITLTSTYQQFATASQTLTNPTVGFRIVTSGDEIDVDFCQAETGTVATSPIVTVASTVARGADNVSLTGASSLIGQTEGTIYCEINVSTLLGSTARTFVDIGSSFNRVFLGFTSVASNTIRLQLDLISGALVDIRSVVSATGIIKVACAYKSADSALFVNGVQATDVVANPVFGAFPLPLGSVFIGQTLTNGALLNDNIRSAVLFPTRLSNSQLQALTT